MCGGIDPGKVLDPAGLFTKDKTPSVNQTDPQAEADAAADAAAKASNADAAARKKRKQGSSLLATGTQGASDSGSSLLASGASGKPTLGA
ncbi:hypothetical protein JOE25_000550 [Serratia sp. PL17]|uniref:hypothetical protein n=1 Tax=Serratia sp. PL17 TaxID=2806582 RepID=UPI001B6962EA|nr:hypothetical protein [Serratia sp. PL17]MBP1129007.1 hypothetical protein [Serratia sp. PL17]